MNKLAVGAGALAVVAGGSLGFGAFSGAKVADELQKQTAALAAFPGVKVVENSVAKGLLSSVHTATLDIGCAADAVGAVATGAVPVSDKPAATDAPAAAARKPLQITWRDTVRHGPLPGGQGVGLATIDSELVLPPEAAAQLAKVFGKQPALSVHTALAFGGTYVSTLQSPPFKIAEEGKGDIDWQGLRATVRGKLSGGLAAGSTYTLEAPGLNLNLGSAGSLRIGKMSMQGEVLPSADASLLMAPSKGSGAIASMAFSFTPPQADAKPVNVLFEGLQFSSDAKLDQGLFSTVSKMSAKGRVDDFAIDKVEMQVSMNRIHAATYQALMGTLMQQAASCNKPADEAAAAKRLAALNEDMQKAFGALLAHNPEYALDRLAIELGGKTAELSYRLGTKGVTSADAQTPMQALLTTKGYGAASIKVQRGWIEQVVKKVVMLKPLPEGASAETMVASTMGILNATLDGFAAQGFLASEGDAVTAKATFEGGVLKVNDKPMDLPLGAQPK
jgi:uncharacterized protein YdgA (DUF945 family)